MCKLFMSLAIACMVAGHASASLISYTVTDPPAAPQATYHYSISGVTFAANEELDIEFDPATFSNLTDAVAGPGFLVMVFQPDDRPGLQWPGEYSLLSLVNGPSLNAAFSVDFTYSGVGDPGPQRYSINQFDSNGNFVATLETGFTTPAVSGNTPEPGSILLCVVGVLTARLWRARRPLN